MSNLNNDQFLKDEAKALEITSDGNQDSLQNLITDRAADLRHYAEDSSSKGSPVGVPEMVNFLKGRKKT